MTSSNLNSSVRMIPSLGTYVSVWAEGSSESEVQRGMNQAFSSIRKVQKLMSFHDPLSDISTLNRRAHQEPVTVHPWTKELLSIALALWEKTNGVFDISVGKELSTFGFLPTIRLTRVEDFKVSSSDIQLVSDSQVFFKKPLTIDLGGIAKGFAVDCAIKNLKKFPGISSAIVNAGGDLSVYGPRPQRVFVRHPVRSTDVIPILDLSDGAVATSSGAFSSRVVDGKVLSPYVDPRTRRFQDMQGRSATVVAPTCTVADALTKVVAILGEKSKSILDLFDAEAFELSAVVDSQSDERAQVNTQCKDVESSW